MSMIGSARDNMHITGIPDICMWKIGQYSMGAGGGGGHEEPLHVVANFYLSKQTFSCVKITDRNQKIILNELTLPLAFDGLLKIRI